MGIWGLQKFMETQCEDGYEPVKLSEIVELYKNETGKKPTMLVDISSCVTHLSTSNKEQPLIGKNVKKLKKDLEIFIDNCFNLGINLIVIGEGIKPVEKLEIWIKNGKEVALNVEALYSKRTKCLRNNFHDNFDLGILLWAAVSVLQTTKKCEYRRAIYEADDYILNYVHEFNCFAILTEDSDFIAAENVPYCLSVKNLDIQSMTLMNYNRNNLAKFVDIPPVRLPVYAALCSTLSYNHYNWKNRFHSVADSLKKLSSEEVQKLESLKKVFGMDSDQSFKTELMLRKYNGKGKVDINYTGDENWNKILNLAKKRHEIGVAHRNILGILSEHKIYFSPGWSKIPKNIHVSESQPFLKEIYEILFFEHPQREEIIITEYGFKKDLDDKMPIYYKGLTNFIKKVKVEYGNFSVNHEK